VKRRRPAGDGLVRQRTDGRWEGAIDHGYRDGRRFRQHVYAKTQAELLEKMAAARRQKREGAMPAVGGMRTLARFLREWLANTKPTLRIRSYERYAGVVANHLAPPPFGSTKIDRLTPQHVQSLLDAKRAAGLAPRSIAAIRMILGRALGQAVRWQMLTRNVASLVQAPKAPHAEMKVWAPEQVRVFLSACEGEPLEALYWLALSTGMRRGELLGLKWDDIAFDTGRLSVQRSIGRAKGGLVIDAPKTARGRRQVKLIGPAIAALRAHKARQAEIRLREGPEWRDGGFVFTTSIGTVIDPRNLDDDYRRMVARAGLPMIRFHDLRHSAATTALLQNIHPKIVAEMLGHSRVSVTLDLYSHVLPDMQDEAAMKIEAALTRK
jgi:integrase